MWGFNFHFSENGWKRLAKAKRGGVTLLTTLSLVEGEILNYLEQHGVARLKKVVKDLEWPMAEVIMGVGALIREGLVDVRRDRFGVFLRAC